MRTKVVFLVVFIVFSIACVKENEKVPVQYRVSSAFAETEISYRDDQKDLITEVYPFESGEDIWTWTGQLLEGEIVYLSTRYTDSASSVKVQILVDGKIYKEGSSNNDPNKYLIVSGTVPFDQ
jgi:hypothetical protein